MPRNGSGQYDPLTNTWNPPINGVLATGADFQAQLTDIAAAITQSLSADGQTPMTGNLPLNNHAITGVASGTALAPSIAANGDTNTGVFFPAADQVGISTNGVKRLGITDAGVQVTGALSADTINYPDASVTEAKLATDAVTTAKILNSAVTPTKLSTGAPTWDANGNVGIGVTPSAWVGEKAVQVSWGSVSSGYEYSVNLSSVAYRNNTTWHYQASGQGVGRYEQIAGQHRWYNAPSGTAGSPISFTQAMALDASGNLLVGTPTGTYSQIKASGGYCFGVSQQTANNNVFNVDGVYTSGTQNLIVFSANTITTGIITYNGSSVSYTTLSDHRLKENIQPMQGAFDKVMLLKPCTYKWKSNGESGQGFIAHELQAIVPECVTGEKDAVRTVDVLDDGGNVIGTKEEPVYQGIDTSFLVATLTAALQEAHGLIKNLQARVEALEAK